MKKPIKTFICLLLIMLISLSTVTACGRQTEEVAPETGYADKSNLAYADALDGYKKTDWTASWIWTKNSPEDAYVAFRKTFTLKEDVSSAKAYISADSKYVLWVNGVLTVLDGALKRGATPYDSYYDEVEITNLNKGKNAIAIQVAFNGRSGDGSIVPVLKDEEGDEYPQGGLIFEMNVGGTVIKSDSSFKAVRLTEYKNRVLLGADYPNYTMASMLAERNVYYDARDAVGDFTALDFDDSKWEDATLIAKAGAKPFGDLYAPIIKPIKFGEITDFANSSDYVGKTLTEDTTLVLPFPTNCQFTFYFELESSAGKKLTIYTDTYQFQDGLLSFKDTYVTKDGAQSYENYPWRSGTDLIIEAEKGVKFTKIAYRISEFNGEKTEAFTSSNESLNILWKKAQNTIAVCMRDTFMDCPERERGPYMGDASNEVDATLYGYDYEGLQMIKKAILTCVGWTTTSNAIPSRAPSVKPQEIPNQSLAFMTSAYHYYLHSGDAETMRTYYEASVNYLKLFEMGENGLPKYRYGSWTWNDWGTRIDNELLQVGFYYYCLSITKSLGEGLGITSGADFLTERMTTIKQNFRNEYYTADGFKSKDCKYIDDRANALLALSGLADKEDYDEIIKVLTTTYQASPFCEKYVIEALCVMDRVDLAMERMLYRYDGMINDVEDTLWEQFDKNGGTFNHGWTAGPLYIISKYIAGIRPVTAGFETYEIVLSELLDSFTVSEYTVKGDIVIDYARGSSTVITVSAIAAEGIVKIPVSMGTNVTVSGGEYQNLGTSDGYILIKITKAATYSITVE